MLMMTMMMMMLMLMTKRQNNEFNIVISGQFRTLAVFLNINTDRMLLYTIHIERNGYILEVLKRRKFKLNKFSRSCCATISSM